MSVESTKTALDSYFKKQAKRATPKPPRKNQKPEITLTVHPCLEWLNENAWSVDVVESKAVYNAQAGRYLEGQTIAGMPDIVGCTPLGIGAFIECKAPGKLSSLRPGQREFLKEKIECGAFAVVVDSVDRLQELWMAFCLSQTRERRIDYLIQMLPKESVKRKKNKESSELDFL